MFDILHRYTGAILFSSATANDIAAATIEAVGKRANLRGADLGGADLRGADLGGANLRGANLRDAKGINANACTPLLMLLDQPEKIRAYKLVTSNLQWPWSRYGAVTYTLGEVIEVKNANTDPFVLCAAGINVATLDWCMREWGAGYKILVVEFSAADIAAIPTATDGKFRLHRCVVVGEKDLSEIGLMPKTKVV